VPVNATPTRDTDELLKESLVKPIDPREVAELFEQWADGR
jgi:hypothetical protein